MTVSIHFFLGWKEYFTAQEFFRQSRYSMVPERVIGGVIMAFSAWWFFINDLNLFATIGLGIGLAIIFGAQLFRSWSSKRKWNREPLYHAEHRVSFSEEGVNFLMGRVESHLDWKYYQRMLESPDGFLLIYGSDSFNLFPKRAFPDDEAIAKFRSLATKKLRR
jgi:YcxB-like protein